MMKVKDIGPEFTLVQDIDDIEAVADHFGIHEILDDFSCLFVYVENGDYAKVYGCATYIPGLEQLVYDIEEYYS